MTKVKIISTNNVNGIDDLVGRVGVDLGPRTKRGNVRNVLVDGSISWIHVKHLAAA